MKLEELEILSNLAAILQDNIDLGALKKFLSKDNPSKAPNSKSINSQNTIFKQLKKKIT